MEPQGRNIAVKIESSTKAIYEKLKSECTTYGELKEKILKEAGQVKWSNPEMACFIQTIILNFWEKDVRNLPIKKDDEIKIQAKEMKYTE